MTAGHAFVLADGAPARLGAALEAAACLRALGRPVALLLKGPALRALADAAVTDAVAALARDGAAVAACQTDMDAAGMTAATLPPGVEPLGLLAFLAEHGSRQLVMA